MHTAAMIVGTTRGIVRDSISQFAGDAIVKFIAASALAPVTFGGSEAAFIADEVVEGTSLAARNAGRVSKVVKETETLAKGAKKSEQALREGGEGFAKATGKEARSAKVEDFNTRAAAHNEGINEHGVHSENQLGKEAGHNERAIDNEQDLAANRQSLDRNQRDIDRALADKDRGDIRAGNRERGPLKDENRRLNDEDKALNRERHDLEQSHNNLRKDGNQLNHESRELAEERRELINERREAFHDHGIGPGRDLHHFLEEHPAAELGHRGLEYGTEAGRNVFTSQGTRDSQIAWEYEEEHNEEIPDGSFVES